MKIESITLRLMKSSYDFVYFLLRVCGMRIMLCISYSCETLMPFIHLCDAFLLHILFLQQYNIVSHAHKYHTICVTPISSNEM